MKKVKSQKSKVKSLDLERRREAFTLLETVVALAIIVSAIAGPFTLASRGVFSAKIARSKLIALNLAQEGIELARHARENNILNGFNWRGAGCAAGSTLGCVNLADGSYQQDVFTAADGSTPPLNSNARLRIMDEITDAYYGVYSQNRGAQTPFTRVVTISTPGDDKMKVVSIVSWLEAGVSRRVELQEVMYNWR